ncbi:hypothetical protein G7066_04145 [Leucobacter coleopterorum]|uniref:DUF4307 domain-containing protein n=1 Tax=Leucobacter coleopterorum TaxID=2714933 RepID=A0ABX6JUR8_9MICO|nr:hypothetical protein [Leucobacter coleopterorum]QIM18051.1 hypothetical protein G7066_04145 [Leucobacter coleopterorum]
MSGQSTAQSRPQGRPTWPIRALVAVAEMVPHTRLARRIILSVVGLLGAVGVVLLGLSVYSLTQGLAPVSGDRASTVRVATIDFLVTQNTAFLEVPACETAEDWTVTCSGKTVDGEALSATSPGEKPETVEISVGERVVYSGSIDDLLSAAADGTKAVKP